MVSKWKRDCELNKYLYDLAISHRTNTVGIPTLPDTRIVNCFPFIYKLRVFILLSHYLLHLHSSINALNTKSK